MIKQLGQVMLYVNHPEQAKKFWTEKLNFVLISDETDSQGMRKIVLAPDDHQTSIVLIDKQVVSAAEPELFFGTPSLMFFTDRLDDLLSDMQDKGITVGEKVELPSGERVFNFADDEENYFAVMEVK